MISIILVNLLRKELYSYRIRNYPSVPKWNEQSYFHNWHLHCDGEPFVLNKKLCKILDIDNPDLAVYIFYNVISVYT